MNDRPQQISSKLFGQLLCSSSKLLYWKRGSSQAPEKDVNGRLQGHSVAEGHARDLLPETDLSVIAIMCLPIMHSGPCSPEEAGGMPVTGQNSSRRGQNCVFRRGGLCIWQDVQPQALCIKCRMTPLHCAFKHRREVGATGSQGK